MFWDLHLLRSGHESRWQECPLPPLALSYTCYKAHPESYQGAGMSMDSDRGADSERVSRAEVLLLEVQRGPLTPLGVQIKDIEMCK